MAKTSAIAPWADIDASGAGARGRFAASTMALRASAEWSGLHSYVHDVPEVYPSGDLLCRDKLD